MTDTIPPLSGPALLLSEGGAHVHTAVSSLESFLLAQRLGATSLGTKGWLTSDGQLTLAPDDAFGPLRRRRISTTARADLPESVLTLDQLLEAVGGDVPVALSLADQRGFEAAVAIAGTHHGLGQLWIRHDDPNLLGTWRRSTDDVHLVNTVRIPRLKEGPERRAATLRSLGIDALEARHSEWSGGLVALMHRFRRRTRATDANYPEIISQLLRMGLDSIGGDHPDRLADAAAAFGSAP